MKGSQRMFGYKCILTGLLLFAVANVQANEPSKKDSLLTNINILTNNDTLLFDELYDTLTYFSGVDVTRGLSYLFSLEKKVNTLNNVKFKISTHILLAKSYLFLGKVDSSYHYIQKAKVEALGTNDLVNLLSVYFVEGWLNMENNNPAQAQKIYYTGLEIAEDIQSYKDQVIFLSALSECLSSFNDIELQLKYLTKAIKIGKEHGLEDINEYQNALYNLASVFQQNGRADSAVAIYDQLEKIYLKQNYISGLASIANNIAHLYIKNELYDSALAKGFEALAYDEVTGTAMYIVTDYITIAKVFKARENIDSAIVYFQKADSLSTQTGMLKRRLEITKNIAQLFASADMHEEASLAFETHLAARDSFNMAQTRRKIFEIEERYHLKQKDAENAFLKESIDKDQRLISLQLMLIVGLGFVFIISIIALIFNKRIHKRINQLNVKLKERNDELHTANDTKNKLFSVISHDLRGPIGTLKNLIQHIVSHENNFSKQEMLTYFKLTDKELTKTYGLIENLLTWARSQFGKIQFVPEKIDIQPFIVNTLSPIKSAALQKEIQLEINVLDCDTVIADREMFAFILRNLVSNAIKFTPHNGKININCSRDKNEYILSIKDTGVGMNEKQISQLFVLSENISTPGTDNEPGTGLGLHLCKEFAEKNNISIMVESEVNVGTTFKLHLSSL